MTAIKTFVPISKAAITEFTADTSRQQLKTLLQQLDSHERKKLLVQEFRDDLDSIVAEETTSAVAAAVEQAQEAQQQRLLELEAEQSAKLQDKAAQLQVLLNNIGSREMAINIAEEDDVIAVVAEATFRVLTEHLNQAEHLQRIIHQVAKEYLIDKTVRLRLSEPDYQLVKDIALPENLELVSDLAFDAGAYQLELGKAKISYSLEDRLNELSSALLHARAMADA